MKYLSLCFLFLNGCLGTADMMKLAGFSNPSDRKIVAKKTLTGFTFEAGGDFAGHGHAVMNPDTGVFDIDITVENAQTPVVAAEGERADHGIKYREIETQQLKIKADAYVAYAQSTERTVLGMGQVLSTAALGGAASVTKVAEVLGTIVKQPPNLEVPVPIPVPKP